MRTSATRATERYDRTHDRPVAEFTYDPSSGVALVVFDDARGGGLRRRYMADGAPLDRERRNVLPSEGATFMRALMAWRNMSYYRFVDVSGPAPD